MIKTAWLRRVNVVNVVFVGKVNSMDKPVPAVITGITKTGRFNVHTETGENIVFDQYGWERGGEYTTKRIMYEHQSMT